MDRQVGFRTKFASTGETIYKIREVIELPNFSMEWVWNTGVCPHCKNKLDRVVNHEFYSIEILAPEQLDDSQLTEEDLIVAGFTTDKRYMFIPKDKYKQLLSKSAGFKSIKSKTKVN